MVKKRRGNSILKNYSFPLLLILSILLGGLVGIFFPDQAPYLKPFGDIFLNLIFTAIVPLIFFSVSAAIARVGSLKKLGRIIFYMAVVFLFTSFIAALVAMIVVIIFPPAKNIAFQLSTTVTPVNQTLSTQLVNIFTVSDFSKLLSHENMLALIVFSILVGLATTSIKNEKEIFVRFLSAGEQVFMRVFSLIMYYAPIGFFAYFAVLVSELGAKLIENYLRVAIIYYVMAVIYFFVIYTVYAYLAAKKQSVKIFWKNIFLPTVTAIATCSSAASIPANLAATKQMGVAPEIYETTIPLGSMIHKDGSVIGGMIKIAFLFGLFHLDFTSASVLILAIGVSILVGTVMGAIPSGGMLGELLILNVYGFPSSVLILIAAISIIIDPPATMLNVTGNSISSLLIARLVDGKKWIRT